MGIERVSSTAALIAALRGEVTTKTEGAGRTRRADARPVAGRPGGAPSMAQLRRQLVDIAREVDLQDAAAVHQARGRFVRAILLWEFGQALREHPEWRTLTEGIERSLDTGADPASDAFVKLLKDLQKT